MIKILRTLGDCSPKGLEGILIAPPIYGYLKMKYTMFITSLFAFAFGCGPSDRALSIAEFEGEVTSGRALYMTECAQCHGANAQGGVGPNLINAFNHHDDVEVIEVILEGDGSMPSFSRLKDQDIADILAFINTL